MNSHRRGHSYRRRHLPPRPIANPAAHSLKGRINQLKREIEQVGEIAARFQVEPVGLGEKQEALETLEKQLEKVQ